MDEYGIQFAEEPMIRYADPFREGDMYITEKTPCGVFLLWCGSHVII